MSRRVLITGSRNWTDKDWVWQVLDEMVEDGDTIVHGACPTGADYFADLWCKERHIQVERHPADWDTYGKAAGPIRNQHMVAKGADVCVGFPMLGSRGSWDCLKRAEKAGIPIFNMGESYGD